LNFLSCTPFFAGIEHFYSGSTVPHSHELTSEGEFQQNVI
jgi:hypothetical protein